MSDDLLARELSRATQCEQESIKATINKVLLEKVCLQAAKKAEVDKNYDSASWYYLLAGKADYLLSDLEKTIDTKNTMISYNSIAIYINVGHAHVLLGKYQNAVKNYQYYLKISSISKAKNSMQNDYNILRKLYPNKIIAIEKGLKKWDGIYSSYQPVDILNQKHKKAYKSANYEKSLGFLKKITLLLESNAEGSETYHLANNYSQIGGIYYVMKKYTKALEYKLKGLAIQEKILDKKHPSLAYSYSTIGASYASMKNYPKALEYQLKALPIIAIIGKKWGEGTYTIQRYKEIGTSYHAMSNYPKSLEYKLKALIISEKTLGKQDPYIENDYATVGKTYHTMGDYPKALEYQLKVLAIQKKELLRKKPVDIRLNEIQIFPTADYTDIIDTYKDIEEIYLSMNNRTKAQECQLKELEYHLKALAIREKIEKKRGEAFFGFYSKSSYKDIGELYYDMGNYSKALECQLKRLTILEKSLDKQYPDIASGYGIVGKTYHTMGDYPKALEYQLKALAIQEKLLSKQPVDVTLNTNNVKTQLFRKKTSFPTMNHMDIIKTYQSIEKIYLSMSDGSKAEEYQLKALALGEFFSDKKRNTQ